MGGSVKGIGAGWGGSVKGIGVGLRSEGNGGGQC